MWFRLVVVFEVNDHLLVKWELFDYLYKFHWGLTEVRLCGIYFLFDDVFYLGRIFALFHSLSDFGEDFLESMFDSECFEDFIICRDEFDLDHDLLGITVEDCILVFDTESKDWSVAFSVEVALELLWEGSVSV